MTDRVDFEAVTQLQQGIWSLGDFAKIGISSQIVAEELCEFVDLLPGERVLDVACGAGNAAIAAARRHAHAVALDYVPALLERARQRAAAEGYEIEFVEGDAQALPFEEASFDVVLSTFGAMFAPDQERTARELLRVCKPGGRIGMANWPPHGLIGGEMFRMMAERRAAFPYAPPPALWGTEERLRELLGTGISELGIEPAEFILRYKSPEHWLSSFRRYFGPMIVAFDGIDEAGAAELERDLIELMRTHNRAGEAGLVAAAEYVRVLAVRA